ncbi:hypothetical protein DI09_103p60 [Mitosporidium daphniae]|uniref:26S proteasome complex subunit SEM1 n=1 Tax=Mitosporidium daphniae TaxID=1485682 RepID=A0A098VWB7_9MICR|nr:uncharacterized protein DI09_103p60 [Mitosporidium daphniae]KGG53210.1 hypothetical protein DI09_103p60 [Mitosporidium daphniae]|eukprot:XP_013239649.1 uncharacterized protein DI09_103p60 [Mitosporidium daphniae]
MSASAINNATAVASDPLLAADEDSFEEFTADEWNPATSMAAPSEETFWQKDWDDEDVEDDFSANLRFV